MVHRDNKFSWIIKCGPGWDDRATGLQVTPLQRTVDAVEDEDHCEMTALGSLTERRGATFTAASVSLSFSNGHLTRRQRRTSAGFSCIFPRQA